MTKTIPTIEGAGTVVRAAKKGEKRLLRVTVFPQGGGGPYEEDVEPDKEGLFTLADTSTFKVARGSVTMGRDGVLRAICHEGNPYTINVQALDGDDTIHPRVLHGIVHNNLVAQFDSLQKNRGMWRQAGTYGLILVGVGLLLVGIWMVQAVGGGLEALSEAVKAIEVSPATGPGSAGVAGPETGHNPIAPKPGAGAA